MKVILIRHAIAEDKLAFARSGKPDSDRPLTSAGKEKMKRAAKGLRNLVPAFNALATSPYRRAKDTATIVCKFFKDLAPVSLEALEPGGNKSGVLRWLAKQRRKKTVGLVGHQPDLSQLIGQLLVGQTRSFLDLK